MTTILREARIIMPACYEKGERAHHAIERMEQRIVAMAGGFTCGHSVGGWQAPDSGEVIEEEVLVYDVAISEGQNAALLEIALTTGRALDQHSVYFRNSGGVVSIIEVDKAEEELSRGGPIPAEAPKPTRRPHDATIGDIWETRDGSLVAFVRYSGARDDHLVATMLKRGREVSVGSGCTLSYPRKLNGAFMYGSGSQHALDLIKLHSTF